MTALLRSVRRRELLGRKAHRASVDVGEHRRAAGVNDRVGGRGERHRRDDDLLAGFDPERDHRQVKRRGAGVHAYRMLGPDVLAELLLEAMHARARSDPGGAQGRHHLVDLGVEQLRGSEDEVFGASGSHDVRVIAFESAESADRAPAPNGSRSARPRS